MLSCVECEWCEAVREFGLLLQQFSEWFVLTYCVVDK